MACRNQLVVKGVHDVVSQSTSCSATLTMMLYYCMARTAWSLMAVILGRSPPQGSCGEPADLRVEGEAGDASGRGVGRGA